MGKLIKRTTTTTVEEEFVDDKRGATPAEMVATVEEHEQSAVRLDADEDMESADGDDEDGEAADLGTPPAGRHCPPCRVGTRR